MRCRTSRGSSSPKDVRACLRRVWGKPSMWHSARQNRRHAMQSLSNVSRTGLCPDFFLRGCSTPFSQSNSDLRNPSLFVSTQPPNTDMKRRPNPGKQLPKPDVRLNDAKGIDVQYGLEPVIDPSSSAAYVGTLEG